MYLIVGSQRSILCLPISLLVPSQVKCVLNVSKPLWEFSWNSLMGSFLTFYTSTQMRTLRVRGCKCRYFCDHLLLSLFVNIAAILFSFFCMWDVIIDNILSVFVLKFLFLLFCLNVWLWFFQTKLNYTILRKFLSPIIFCRPNVYS